MQSLETNKNSIEFINDMELSNALRKDKGSEETNELYTKWRKQLESEWAADPFCQYKIALREAQVYFNAGYKSEAVLGLQDLREKIIQEGPEALFLRLELEGMLGSVEQKKN